MIIHDVEPSFSRHRFVIATAGYETRSTAVVRAGLAANGIALTYSASALSERHAKNLAFYESAGWAVVSEEIGMAQLSAELSSGLDTLVVDYSSMPRRVIAQILQRLNACSHAVDVTFLYFEPTFRSSEAAAMQAVNLTAGPVLTNLSGDARPLGLPVGLVLGLGMERHRGLGVVELLEPERTWALVAESSDPSFADAATANHAPLFGEVDAVSLLSYPLESVSRSYAMLLSLITSASADFRVALVPSGPKPLALAAMLAAQDYSGPRPAVWRVGAQSTGAPSDVQESGGVVAVNVLFERE